MDNLLIYEEQIKALVIYKFLCEYSEFENQIKIYFIKKVNNLNQNDINQLYFYYGGLATKNIYIDYDNNALTMQNHKFNSNNFHKFSINQIIKISKTYNNLIFNDVIDSDARKIVKLEINGSIIRLINMRNKISHNLSTLKLGDTDCIELLPLESLQNYCNKNLSNIEIKDNYNDVKIILSNLIYMKKISEKLQST